MKKLIKFLRKPRWFTQSKDVAENTIWQWGSSPLGGYQLSLLGAINGILPYLGVCLVAINDERLELRRPWW